MGPGNLFRPPDLYEKRSSYPKAIILNILALERATEKIRGKAGATPKKTYAYEKKKKAPAPAKEPVGTSYSIPTGGSSFSNTPVSSPTSGSPSRTAAHAPSSGAASMAGA